jgi:predicted AAA+ superfamily ATPase
VVLIHGPRQSGKTTLAQVVGKRQDYACFSFDDNVLLAAATADPVGFVGDLPERAILDEVQRAPGIFAALTRSDSTISATRTRPRWTSCWSAVPDESPGWR